MKSFLAFLLLLFGVLFTPNTQGKNITAFGFHKTENQEVQYQVGCFHNPFSTYGTKEEAPVYVTFFAKLKNDKSGKPICNFAQQNLQNRAHLAAYTAGNLSSVRSRAIHLHLLFRHIIV